IYLAFKYTSDPELGAARWNIDDLSITNRTTLLSASPVSVDFSEVAVGTNSAGLPVNIQAFGFGALLLSAPAVYQLSADNLTFTDNLSVSGGQAETGAIVYIRFTPASKELKTTGRINFKSASLDSNLVFLSGSSFPKSETLDVAAYNLSFFGSTPNNNPTPEKILLQVNNIATIFQRLNMDVVGFEEMSNDDALASLLQKLPGYQSVTSPRWSYSFDPPDPGFPPQKIGFVYNATTAQLVEQRVMFESMYDSARNGLSTPLNNYPLNSPSSFWASGRLPFMATFDVTIKGVLERIRIIVIHGKSASDVASYNRRVYDVRVLKDSLDAYYPNDNIVLIGDFNDRVTGSILAGSPSPYMGFVDDSTDYAALTLPLDKAGRISFVSGTGLIDHIVISNELKDNYISNSTDIEDARSYIPNYNASTASDHLPVFSRFTLSAEIPLPVNILYFEARPVKSQVKVSWTTATELTNSHFIVERSGEVLNFVPMSKLDGAGTTTNRLVNYQFIDWFPLPGFNYYRLKQVDLNGKETFSQVVLVNMLPNTTETVSVYPNPVAGKLQIRITSPSKIFVAHLLNSNGNTILQAKGNINEINRHLNNYIGQLQSGLYILRLNDRTEWHTVKIIKQ
ncbi:MAG: T9SS type A sorting domain-containing protein, partial [Chitinophagaceae bacterium]